MHDSVFAGPVGNQGRRTEAQDEMAEAQKRMSQTALKRRQRFHPKRDVKPVVLAQANRKVIWIAGTVIAAFLAIVVLQALFG
jgi:beta-lactamase regulating signal transducer with metallopeptidase domain